MNSRIFLTALSGMALSLMIIVIGCSSGDKTDSGSDSMSEAFAEEMVESTYDDIEVESSDAEFALDVNEPNEVTVNADDLDIVGTTVRDIIVKDHLIYALIDSGIIIHNLSSGENRNIPVNRPVGAMTDLGEKIVLGGDNLYTLDGDILSDNDYKLDLAGSVTVLHRQDMRLYIGTTEGLYELGTDGIRELASDIYVSAITNDDAGVWVGTAGQGLYRWDGVSFRKRYLQRDSTLFDHVTALAYNRNHLYLGTDRGFFVHDGGRWQPYDLADGLPSETITTINADDWVIKVGTTRGAVTFFNNEFKPIQKFAGLAVYRFVARDNKLLAATAQSGLVMKSGGIFTVLYDGRAQAPEMAADDSW